MVSQVALAADEKPAAEGAQAKADFSVGKGLAVIGACIGAGLCAIGGGMAIGKVGGATLDAIARQPEAAGQMFTPMNVAGAMIEGGMFFAIVIALLSVLKL
ncbi:MAG: ATP synthase F0 subunit C [Planctomycetota bacterium]|nr:ATP synthase F0 subunit C [Planctomycetota bacterium]